MSQISIFNFSKSVVARFKLHIFWHLYHQWCGLSILLPRIPQYKPQHRSVLFAHCFLCLVDTVKQRSKSHGNGASRSFLLLEAIAFSCGRIRSLTPSPPAECPCQDMAFCPKHQVRSGGTRTCCSPPVCSLSPGTCGCQGEVLAALYWTLAPPAMRNDCHKNSCDQPNVCGYYKHCVSWKAVCQTSRFSLPKSKQGQEVFSEQTSSGCGHSRIPGVRALQADSKSSSTFQG